MFQVMLAKSSLLDIDSMASITWCKW